MRLFFSTLLLICVVCSLHAQIRLSNPGVPAKENLVYAEKIGTQTGVLKQTVALKTENNKTYYEIVTNGTLSDIVYRVDAKTLDGFYSQTVERNPDSTIRRELEILSSSPKIAADELLVSDLNSLPFSLRGFPWGKINFAKLAFSGVSSTSSFSLELNIQGVEKLKIGGKSYECYKVQMGLGGILGGFVPMSFFWYSTQSPNILVRYEGSQGGPGSPVRVLELQSYEAAEAK